MNEILLMGLDGSNPLAFLAALGVLEATAARWPTAQLRWTDVGVWRPALSGGEGDLEALLAVLEADRASCRGEPALELEYDGTRDLKPPPPLYRSYLQALVQECGLRQRRSVDWAAAFATDVVVDNNGNTKPTALHFTAGQQTWLKMVGELVAQVTLEDLREAIVGRWRYQRPLPVLGWDSTSAREYALRASNPGPDKKTGVPGADWLAVRGLASLPVVPQGVRAQTTCCTGEWKTGRFTWPLWESALSLAMVRSTLRLPGLIDLSEGERRARGIAVVLQSCIRRHDQGGYGSFSPATVV